MTRERNQSQFQSEARLSTALRELAEASDQGASTELGLVLKDAFRRHHVRRRRMLRMRIGLACIALAGLTCWWLLPRKTLPTKTEDKVAHAIPAQQPSRPADAHVAKPRQHRSPVKASAARISPAAPEPFVALPAWATLTADDELRVVRLEMPGEDLRLVGAPVTEKMIMHRVTADFVVGHDGTPYAVRLVQSNY